MIYFVQIKGEPEGPIKIGYASSPRQRIASLQVANHKPLCVRRIIEGGVDVESQIHSRFRHLHIRGEWFRFDASMLSVGTEWKPSQVMLRDIIAPLVQTAPVAIRADKDALLNAAAAAIKTSDLSQVELARKFGVTANTISNWANKRVAMSGRQFIKACSIFGTPFVQAAMRSDRYMVTYPNTLLRTAVEEMVRGHQALDAALNGATE